MIVLELYTQDLQRIYKVDLMVYKYFKSSLCSFCEKYGYDKFFVEILKQVTEDYAYEKLGYFAVELEDDLEERYYEIESKYNSYTDKRSIAERIIALGVNWVVEDILVHKSSGCFILTGCDNSRDLLSNPITNVPDIRYVGEGKSFYVEVCSDFNSFMDRFKRYDLRKIKFYKMSDMVFIDKQLIVLMFIDVVNKKYLRVPFNRLLVDIYRNGRDDLIDKYKYNTVCFEFGEDDELQPLDDLFEKLRELSNGYISDNNGTYRVEKEEKLEQEPTNIENSVVLVEEKEPEIVESQESIESVIDGFYSQVGGLSSNYEQLGLELDDCPKEFDENKSELSNGPIKEPDYPSFDINPFTGEMDDFSPF